MSFLGGIFKSKIFRTLAPIIVGAFNPVAGAAVGAALGASNHGGIIGGLTGAAGGYFGGSALSGGIGGAMGTAGAGGIYGPVQGGFSSAISGASAGLSGAGTALGNALGLSSGMISSTGKIANVLGAASMFGSGQQKQALGAQKVSAPNAGQGFVPQRPDAISRPQALQDLASYSPEQERSALATRGVNQGLGNDENSYYRNLLQRSLIGEGNKVNVDNPNWLMPIESQYFSGQGHDTSNILKFLQGIHG